MKKAICMLVFLLGWGAQAWALNVLKGKEASDHIGDAKAHFVDKGYTYELLKRKHRDSMHGRFSDALIFNTDGGLFRYPTRKDGEHHLILDDPNGREEEPVNEEEWRKNIANSISDDNPTPTVFLDDQGKELAIAYVGRGANLAGKIGDSGLLELNINVDGSKGNQTRRRGYA